MSSQMTPNRSDILSTKNLTKFRDELYKGGVIECYHQRCQRQVAAECTESSLIPCAGPPTAPESPHTPAPAPPPVIANSTTVTAQVYAKGIIEKLAKDSAQDKRLVREFVNVKFAFVMQLRALFNWAFHVMGVLYKLSTLQTHRDIARPYRSILLAYQRKRSLTDARGFICRKAFVIVRNLINHCSSKAGILEYLGVLYYSTGRELLRLAQNYRSWYPNLLVTLFQRVEDRLTEEMSTNECHLFDIVQSLDGSLCRSIIHLHQRTLLLGVQQPRTRYLEEIEAIWACYKDSHQEDIDGFGELWEWMAGRELHLKLGKGEMMYPFPDQDLGYQRKNLRHAMFVLGGSVESDGREEDLDQDIGQRLHPSGMSIRRVGPGEGLRYHCFPGLGHAMLCVGKKTETNDIRS